jgi:hypothetical protein
MIKEYFSHDYHPIADDKMFAMVSEWGAVGYGLYWHIVEKLHISEGNVIVFNAYTNLAIANQMKVDAKQIAAFIEDCVTVFELFKRENDKVFCERVFRNIGKRKEITEARKAAGSKGGAAKAKQTVAIAKQNTTNRNENIKVKEKEKKDIIIADANASENYKKFFDWAYTQKNAIRVMSMEKPLTADEYDKLFTEIGKEAIFQQVQAMENYKDLHKKNISAHLTIKNWHNRNNK